MPSLLKAYVAAVPAGAAPSASERFTRALLGLTRTVWHPGCTFETAIEAICEAAARALQIDRVSVWHYDREAGLLRCLSAYLDGARAPPEAQETLSLEGDDYMASLEDVRTFDAADLDADPGVADSHGALRDYLRRHGIQAMLDAPARVAGELQAVICHESVNHPRSWSREEVTFAASMGDCLAMAYEVARRRRAEREVAHLRLHDGSTGLPNRDYMLELIRQRLLTPRRPDEVLAVVHVRIDASPRAALSADAPTVEEVMLQIAKTLRRLGSEDIDMARVRADGFAFLLARNHAERGVIQLAERCLAAVRGLQWQHVEMAQQVEIDPGAAVGIVFAEAGTDHDARVLMRQAEEAAGRAAAREKYAYEVFDPEHHAGLVEGLRFERALRDAFAQGKFELHYQLEFDAVLGQWVAAEALLRWRDGERLVEAAHFIGVVESSGLILPVGSWVLHRACHDAMQWPTTAAGPDLSVRVNVSTRQFDEAGLVADVTMALAESGLPAARLCLEITETTLMRDIDRALDVLQQLRALGVQVAIDDFGTGYASLVYLKRLPVNVLKIDRSFVEGIPGLAIDIAIVKAIIGLADSLGIDVIAEGVERIEQQAALQAIGVRRMQGWLYAKAVDHARTCQLLGIGCGSIQPVSRGTD